MQLIIRYIIFRFDPFLFAEVDFAARKGRTKGWFRFSVMFSFHRVSRWSRHAQERTKIAKFEVLGALLVHVIFGVQKQQQRVSVVSYFVEEGTQSTNVLSKNNFRWDKRPLQSTKKRVFLVPRQSGAKLRRDVIRKRDQTRNNNGGFCR